MSAPRIGRFFSPKGALIAGALFAVGCALSLLVVYGLLVEHRVSIRLSVAALFFLVLGVALVPGMVFRRGCKSCGVKLEDHAAAYPPEAYEHVLAALSYPPGPAVTQLAAHRLAGAAQHRTLLSLAYCPRCMRVGVARVSEEVWKGQYYDARRSSGDVTLVDQQMATPIELVGLAQSGVTQR